MNNKTGVKLLVYFKEGRTGGFKMRFFGKKAPALYRARMQIKKWANKYETAIIYDIATDTEVERYVQDRQLINQNS